MRGRQARQELWKVGKDEWQVLGNCKTVMSGGGSKDNGCSAKGKTYLTDWVVSFPLWDGRTWEPTIFTLSQWKWMLCKTRPRPSNPRIGKDKNRTGVIVNVCVSLLNGLLYPKVKNATLRLVLCRWVTYMLSLWLNSFGYFVNRW